MTDARDRWWIIGSAAVALHGAETGVIGDVDVLLSRRDAEAICSARKIAIVAATPHPRFRSGLFACWTTRPLTVEFMADLDVVSEGRWQRLAPRSREMVATDGGPVYVPDRAELTAILRRFGRHKDLARAAALDRR